MTAHKATYNTAATPGPDMAPIAGGLGGGKAATFYDYFTTPTGMAADDTIEFGPPNALRKGDTFLDFQLWHGALGAGLLATLGDDDDPDRYMTSADVAAAATSFKGPNVAGGIGYTLTQDRPLRLTLTGGAAAAAQTIRLSWRVLRP